MADRAYVLEQGTIYPLTDRGTLSAKTCFAFAKAHSICYLYALNKPIGEMKGIINRPRPSKPDKIDFIMALASILFLAYCIVSGQWVPAPLAYAAIFLVALALAAKWAMHKKGKSNPNIHGI